MKRILLAAGVALAVAAPTGLVMAQGGRPVAAPAVSAAIRVAAQRPHNLLARPIYVPAIRHVFVINIENKGYDVTWGDASKAPYLSRTLRAKGVLLNSYYGTAHNSQGNYIAQISGQGPNPEMQADCQTFSQFQRTGTQPPEQAVGSGCVFPTSVASLPRQLTQHGWSWKGYMEDLPSPCYHPAVGAQDPTQQATKSSQYATRHNPFVYFHSIIDHPKYCAHHVVKLPRLRKDLQLRRTTPHLSYITPDLCSDGHDTPCVDGRPGGLASVDAFLKKWVPRILASRAYQRNGMLIITADEADNPVTDSSACCGEGASANTPQPGILGPGGGRVGALVISRWTRGNTWSTTHYNHYSLEASLAEIFGVAKLGYAKTTGLNRFGLDVYNNGWR